MTRKRSPRNLTAKSQIACHLEHISNTPSGAGKQVLSYERSVGEKDDVGAGRREERPVAHGDKGRGSVSRDAIAYPDRHPGSRPGSKPGGACFRSRRVDHAAP